MADSNRPKAIDPAVGIALDAALVAFDKEALLWLTLPNHGGARGHRASRRVTAAQHSFHNGSDPLPKPTEHSFETMREREQHIRRECMAKAVEAFNAAGKTGADEVAA